MKSLFGSLVIVTLVMTAPVASRAETVAPPTSTSQPTPNPGGNPSGSSHTERHPELWLAMNDLANAKRALGHSPNDSQNHRLSAINHIDAAMHELHAAEELDSK